MEQTLDTLDTQNTQATTPNTTTKKPTIKIASWKRRLFGFMIDLLIISIIHSITVALLTGYDVTTIMNNRYNYRASVSIAEAQNLRGIAQFGILAITFIYYFIFELITARTIGKLVVGTIILNATTNRKPNVAMIFSRSLIRFIPFEVFSFITYTPYGWHDRWAGTYVTTLSDKRLYETGKDRPSLMARLVRYFFTDILNKGFQRLLIVGSVIVPLLIGYIAYNDSGSLIEGFEDKYGYYDEGAFYGGCFGGLIFYWLLYFVIVWIYKGFKESRKPF